MTIDHTIKESFEKANEKFAAAGERVLAFAMIKLDPKQYKKGSYDFGVEGWRTWEKVKKHDPSIAGWFPMWDLTLVGLVSLNDPPRNGVPQAVKSCRAAGIKVIMVTGDQPLTAAAIAHKVNIITNPKLEYNTLLRENPDMEPSIAWHKAESIVIHGDELAKVCAAD